jgi:hypothetical protein
MKKQNKFVGSSLDDFLKEEGTLEEMRAITIKEILSATGKIQDCLGYSSKASPRST